MDGNDDAPHLTYPDLQPERLLALVQLVRQVRAQTYEPEAVSGRDELPVWGDDGPWGLGCLAYDRLMRALTALSKVLPWLKVAQTGSLAYHVLAGTTPLRFGRADRRAKPAMRAERQHLEDAKVQTLLDLGPEAEETEHCLRLDFAVDGAEAKDFRLRAWSMDGTMLLREWIIDTDDVAAAPTAPAVPLVAAKPQTVEPAGFTIAGSDEDEGESEGNAG